MKSYRETDREIFLRAAKSVRETFVLKLPEYRNPSLLDIGCWDGSFTIETSEALGIKKGFIHGVEAAMESYERVYGGMESGRKEIEHAQSLWVQVSEWDLNVGLPFPDNSFDIITANQVLEHVWKVDHLLKEIYRVLKDDGIFIVGVPNLASLHERVSFLFWYNPSTWHTADVQIWLRKGASTGGRCHVNGFTVNGFNFLLKYYNFQPLKKFVTEVYFSESGYIPFLSKIFPNFALSQAYICKKIK